MSGAVSEEVWRKIRVQFGSLDKNRDGKITVKEVEEVLAAQNLDYSPQKIRYHDAGQLSFLNKK